MNDRYLFKAKRKNWKELPKEEWWVQGYLFDNGFVDDIRYFIGGLVIEEYKGTACDDFDITGTNFYEIDDTTICQCTGLRDKDKNLIWENDIVYAKCNGLSGKGVVKFENGCFVLKDCKRNRTYSLFGEWKFRVDGNIFDNPELLEVK